MSLAIVYIKLILKLSLALVIRYIMYLQCLQMSRANLFTLRNNFTHEHQIEIKMKKIDELRMYACMHELTEQYQQKLIIISS